VTVANEPIAHEDEQTSIDEVAEAVAEERPPLRHGASPAAGLGGERLLNGDGEAVRVRMGLHTGEAIKDADDFFGRNVIFAARIADEAEGGEILVSSLKELTESVGEFVFENGRVVALKGLSGTGKVYSVDWS
jgi:adenylate cyclase